MMVKRNVQVSPGYRWRAIPASRCHYDASPYSSRACRRARRARLCRADPRPGRRARGRGRRPRPAGLGPDRLGQDRRLRPRHGRRAAGRPNASAVAGAAARAWSSPRPASWRCRSAASWPGSTPTAGARVATCVGGMDPRRSAAPCRAARTSSSARPGRLRDHLERGKLDLSALRVVVLDEADEMLDMGFREDLEEILDATPDERRTLLFSATMPRPIAALAKRYQQRRAAHRDRSATTSPTATSSTGRSPCRPTEIEHAVVNLLRFYEAETRDRVLRHPRRRAPPPRQPARARLRRRRAVGRAQPERAQPRAAGAARRPRPGLRRHRRRRPRPRPAAISASSSTPTCRATPRPCCTAAAAPAAPGARASPC